ncbi:glycine zipper 2TM domain-containing protein [Novosphingobium aerophilum]|uniref:glycine zipper 2TM domain-containing protein n=1 Tax=Novosphingobium TaxID=165696 RepID=UPI0006C8A25C|nr:MULTISPECIES: glycine zipper 2TM domain-containing protein [unclassified Novosphingobium]KPH64811.1 hypothetical protein ADT71_11025 [Novosphingobium sp. ST904]TCM34509.1 glycine zipper 2TM protein [Novosphingobium sp. ST904]WRT92442.1 glycine zipper 2TM domain-containing protein [Novosphingobium sp. RL4]
MKKTLLALTMAALVLPMAAPVAAAPHHDRRGHDRYDRRDYDSRGRYKEPRRMSRNDHAWRGRDGRYYCKRDNGTTGLIIGAGAGALAGHEIAGSGDQTLGTILGGVAGGLLGREIDKGDVKCR